MSNFSIPNSQGLSRQIPNSDTKGELWETFGVDLTSADGKIKASNKLIKVMDSTDDANFGTVYALSTFGSRHYAITGIADKEMYSCSVLDNPNTMANWTKVNTNGVFEEETDVTYFNSLMLVSQDTDIMSWDGSTGDDDYWTTISLGGETGLALTAGVPHMLHTHRGGVETLFVTNGNTVQYANTVSGHSTVTLGTDQTACAIDSGVSAIWVGTYSNSSVNGYVYELYIGQTLEDGTPAANQAYEVDGNVLALVVENNVPYIVTDKGHIQVFNGAGFSTVASFPFAYTGESLEGVRMGSVSDNSISRPVHPRGMRSHNDSIYININTEMHNENETPDRCPTGVWEYNTKTGNLTHRFAFAESTSENGAVLGERSGPILILNNSDTFLLAGATMSGQVNGLYAENKAEAGYGHFTTVEINSGTIQDAHEAAYLKAKTMTGDESVLLKYRIRKRDRQVASFTHASTKVINTTATVTVEVGDEITNLANGSVAHVTSVSTGTTVTSVTLDAVIGTGTINVGIENFKKMQQSYLPSDGEEKKHGGFGTNTWVQYKIVLDGDIELREFISKGNAKATR